MSSSAPQQPLKGGITFADVQSQPNFSKATPTEQLDISNGFFAKHVASQQGFAKASPEEQVSIRQGFNKKYGIDQLTNQLQGDIQSGIGQGNRDVSAASDNSPLQLLKDTGASALGVGANTVNAIGLGIPDLISQKITGSGLTDLAKQSGQAIGASPGVYNDPFGIQSTGGNVAGAVAGLPKLAAVLGKAALPAFAAAPEVSNLLQGKSTLPQAATQTGINLATSFIPGGKTIVGNALKQGAGQAAGGFLGSAAQGGNLQENLLNAIKQGTLGAFLGGVHSTTPAAIPKERPVIAQPEATVPAQAQLPNPKETAIGLHAGLNSKDAATLLQAKAHHENIKAMARDKRSSVNPSKIRKPGDNWAKEVLANLDIHSKSQRAEATAKRVVPRGQHEKLAQQTHQFRLKGGKIAAAHENYLDRNFSKEDKRIINAEVRKIREGIKAQGETETQRATIRREQGKEKAATINKTRQERAIEEKKRQSDLIKSEKEKQKAEDSARKEQEKRDNAAQKDGKHIENMLQGLVEYKDDKGGSSPRSSTTDYQAKGPDEYAKMAREAKNKTAPKKIKHVVEPKVLDNGDIERISNELVGHKQNNELETLNARLAAHRSAARLDHTRNGVTPERSEAIRISHQKALDVYRQKSSQTEKKQSAIELKAGQEANRKELAKLSDQGGKYTPGEKTALQRPAKGLNYEDAKNTKEWDRFSPSDQLKAKIAMKTAKEDGKVIIEYDAERSGDTGQFKLKTVSPLSLDIGGTPENPTLILHATNENGHTGTYYLSQSKANEQTGFASYTHEITALPELNSKAKLGLDENIYHGQRQVSVADVLKRPVRRTAGYTSDTEAMALQGAQGRNVHEVRKEFQKAAKNKAKGNTAKAAQMLDGMATNKTFEKTIEKAQTGSVTPEDFQALKGEIKKSGSKAKAKIEKDTGCGL